MEKSSKDRRITAEYKKLKKIFAGIDANKAQLVDRLIHSLAFMRINIEDLEQSINENGWDEEYTNGKNQGGRKRSAAADAYLQLAKQYAQIIKQLTDLVPPAERKGISKLDAFMAGSKK
jgi:hypothetical protein